MISEDELEGEYLPEGLLAAILYGIVALLVGNGFMLFLAVMLFILVFASEHYRLQDESNFGLEEDYYGPVTKA